MTIEIDRRYPRAVRLSDGSELTLRPLTEGDTTALQSLFLRIPESDRFFLRDDVASPEVVESFTGRVDYERAFPLLACEGERVVADATLIRHPAGYLAHKGEIRVAIDPEYRGRGLGVWLMRELTDFAWDAGLEHVEFQAIRGIHNEAISAAKFIGAFEVGTVTDYVKDPEGGLHDLVFLRVPLGQLWQWSQF